MCQYNVGGSESFTAVCAFNDGYELKTVTARNFKGTKFSIEMAVFKMDIVVATNRSWAASLDDESPEERRLGNKAGKGDKKCSPGDQEECCMANGASGKKEFDTTK